MIHLLPINKVTLASVTSDVSVPAISQRRQNLLFIEGY